MARAEARGYESPLRSEQRAQTRDRILEAATELLADEAVDELTIPLVAGRAGVSVRTVYFHFPTKDDLCETVAERLDTTIGAIRYPDASDELPAFAAHLFREFERNQKIVRVVLKTKAGREVRARGRTRRLRDLERLLGPQLAGLDPLQRRQRLAAIYIFLSGPAWQAMSDYFGLGAEEAGQASSWAMRALLRELERDATGNEDGLE
jgi:AcrR family transcriptional regulator